MNALPPGVAALVDGRPILMADYQRALSLLAGDRREPLAPRERAHVLERLIDEELLIASALAQGALASDRSVRDAVTLAMVESIAADGASRAASEAELRASFVEARAAAGADAGAISFEAVRDGLEALAAERARNAALRAYLGRAAGSRADRLRRRSGAVSRAAPRCSRSRAARCSARRGSAAAHTRSQSFSTWDVRGGDVVAIVSAPVVRGHPARAACAGRGDLDALLRDHLAARIHVARGGAACASAASAALARRAHRARARRAALHVPRERARCASRATRSSRWRPPTCTTRACAIDGGPARSCSSATRAACAASGATRAGSRNDAASLRRLRRARRRAHPRRRRPRGLPARAAALVPAPARRAAAGDGLHARPQPDARRSRCSAIVRPERAWSRR